MSKKIIEIENINNDQIKSENEIKLYNLEMDEFKKIKTAPKDRWFYSIVTLLLGTSSIFLGVMIICLIIVFV